MHLSKLKNEGRKAHQSRGENGGSRRRGGGENRQTVCKKERDRDRDGGCIRKKHRDKEGECVHKREGDGGRGRSDSHSNVSYSLSPIFANPFQQCSVLW